MVLTNCESHPPPQTQQPNVGYRRPPMKISARINAQKVIRSQMAPKDVSGRLHEHDFKKREAKTAGIVARTAQEKTLSSEQTPKAASEKEVIQRRSTAQVCRRSIDCGTAILKGESARPIGQKGEYVRREVQHHKVAGVLLTDQTAGKERKPGLHEKDQVAG